METQTRDREALREELHNHKGTYEQLIGQLEKEIELEPDEGFKQTLQIVRNKLGAAYTWVCQAIEENEALQTSTIANPSSLTTKQ